MSEESKQAEEQKSDFDPISLSAALLAPINSIFEAQIHSARAFLNFILQMGFRHTPTEDDLKDNEDLKNQEDERTREKEEIRKLLKKRETEGLTDDEIQLLKEKVIKYGDLHYQSFDFIDQSGNDLMVGIPNLALLPIKPLAINEAEFSYEFEVKSQNDEFEQMGTVKDKDKKRPWFLIKEPKSIKGEFSNRETNLNKKNIQVNVKVRGTEIPYGLEKLLVHLTNNIESIDKTNQ